MAAGKTKEPVAASYNEMLARTIAQIRAANPHVWTIRILTA